MMIVPQFWAEGRVQHREPGRQVTVRRFGWSDISQQDAQSQTEARAQEALQRILAGAKLTRREPKVSYNGAEGLPIREEILSTHGSTVITRNLYGAHCLNTPGVMFVDIDQWETPPLWLYLASFAVLMTTFIACAVWTADIRWAFVGAMMSLIGSFLFSELVYRTYKLLTGSGMQRAFRRIRKFAMQHPDWNLRVYETPAGYRVLAMHAIFDANSAVVAECFKKLGADPLYVRMCQRQHCFRARISPKPWRMGMSDRIKPRPGVWPVKEKYLPDRLAWISSYEVKAPAFASCRFIQAFGNGATHPEAESVRRIHDEHCRAHADLPLA